MTCNMSDRVTKADFELAMRNADTMSAVKCVAERYGISYKLAHSALSGIAGKDFHIFHKSTTRAYK